MIFIAVVAPFAAFATPQISILGEYDFEAAARARELETARVIVKERIITNRKLRRKLRAIERMGQRVLKKCLIEEMRKAVSGTYPYYEDAKHQGRMAKWAREGIPQ